MLERKSAVCEAPTHFPCLFTATGRRAGVLRPPRRTQPLHRMQQSSSGMRRVGVRVRSQGAVNISEAAAIQ
eukprot:gene761-biopygen6717